MKFMTTLFADDALIVSGLHLINETSVVQFPDRRPLFEHVYKVAKKYKDSRYMPYFHAAAFISAFEKLRDHYNNRDSVIDLND